MKATAPGVSGGDIVGLRPEPALETNNHRSEEPTPAEARLLRGWGRTAPTTAHVVAPRGPDEVAALLGVFDARGQGAGPDGHTGRGGVIPRGLGRSYGDAAQCAGGTVVSTEHLDRIGAIGSGGSVVVGAGVDLHRLICEVLPSGWFIPVSPGTRQVTVGGAIAADVHGKNHHRDGSFCQHVTSVTLATPTGVHLVGPHDDPTLFWATAGGLGLTGIVTEAIVQLLAVDTSWMVVDTERFDDLDGVMARMDQSDMSYRYSVAWLDCAARPSRRGRAVLTRGDHAPRAALPRGTEPVRLPRRPVLRVPVPAPRGLLNATTIAWFNELWFRRSPRNQSGELSTIESYFYPLDFIADWNLLYGPLGFVQYQFVVGDAEALRATVDTIGASGVPSFLAVLKRFGAGNPGPLSFPMEGWTLALDFPIGPPGLPGLLRRLDDVVMEAGGRVYLAKDSRLSPDALHAMYPRLDELDSARRRVDPEGVLRSDLSRRLQFAGGVR